MRRFDVLDSTNRWLLEAARSGAASEGWVCVADHQTAGRGRLGRTWEAPVGASLLCSLLLRPGLSADQMHLVTAAVAVAGRAAAGAFGVDAGIKWPNDLVVDDRKLAGVLAEVEGPWVVVGIGMNLSWAPQGAARLGDVSPDDVLSALLDALSPLVEDWSSVPGLYRAACVTLGRSVRVELPDPADTFTGVAADVSDEGHLLVDVGMCLRTVAAADVVHLR